MNTHLKRFVRLDGNINDETKTLYYVFAQSAKYAALQLGCPINEVYELEFFNPDLFNTCK